MWLKRRSLEEALEETGLASHRSSIIRWEKEGKLTCPRLPNNRGDRVFTEEQLKEIVEAFSPDGKGEWHYKE